MSRSDLKAAVRRGRGAAVGGLAALLAACAAPTAKAPPAPYAPPASGATARLIVRGNVLAGEAYAVLVYDDAEQCSGPRNIGYGNTTRHPPTTTLAAGRPTTLEFVLAKPGKGVCPVRWTFTPVAGRSYLVAGGDAPQGCVARLMDTTDPDRIRVDESARRRNPPGSPGARCLPLAQSPLALPGERSAGGEAVLNGGASADDLKGLMEGGR